ncbi:MFS transporter [Aquibacillus salsiterrae]|uniref:MFS transporter n=1 Tax=Aquibacillus salsiterrae TaxID=2950439 RepID=A0A9X3WD36_9BACI|nr:MFS transporter [Aquibacillus salsiterrae]MDC3416211.1 MFS transporter [Aquibacillus salsiterrae]
MKEQFLLLKTFPDFFKIWLSTIFTSFFERAFLVIIPVIIYDVTNNPQLVSLGTLIETSIILLFGIVGGTIVDSYDTRKVLINTNFLLLALMVISLIINEVKVTIITILITMVFFTAISRTNSLARTSIVLDIFGKGSNLSNANAMMGSVFSLALMLGPIIGSNLYIFSGIRGVLIFGLGVALLAILIFLKMNRTSKVEKQRQPFIHSIREAFLLIKGNRYLSGGILFQSLFIGSGAVFSSLIYIFIKDILHASVLTFSLTITFQGIGNLVGALAFPYLTKKINTSRLIFFYTMAIFSFELVYLIFPNIVLILICSFLVGIGVQVVMVTANSVFMMYCSTNNVGRISGLKNTINNASSILLISIASYFVGYFSIVTVLIINITLCLLSAFIGLKYVKEPKS